MGQVNDWMNEIYPRWVAAHGVMIVTPVHWYQAPSVLKLMIDRLVCADGGNPDPTTTRRKNPEKAKALELSGWTIPAISPDRLFAIVVHGDAEGAETLRRSLNDWLTDMELVPAGGERAAGPLRRLLRAVCDQPRGAGSRHGVSAGGPQRREDALRGSDARARRQSAAAGPRAPPPQAEVIRWNYDFRLQISDCHAPT